MKRRTIRALAAAAALLPGASMAQEMIMIDASAPKTVRSPAALPSPTSLTESQNLR
jgi:hypothetical protein